MQNQILKVLTMVMLIAAVVLMAALVAAHAQSSGSATSQIPIAFVVESASPRAGEYSVRMFSKNCDLLLIDDQKFNNDAARLTPQTHAAVVTQGTMLLFHRYGQDSV
jgi:hypothetical protein